MIEETTQETNYMLFFWTQLYEEERNKVLKLQKEVERLKKLCKECGIGNDHKA
mgnify:CR=1 FL=1|tara:strand:- start:988 stop:1146 length:159 start_codon:yes stop_codon:yes gene_type:complete